MTCYIRSTFTSAIRLKKFLDATSLPIAKALYKGDLLYPSSKSNRRMAKANFAQILVSSASQDNLKLQIRQVTKFLESNSKQVRLLSSLAKNIFLDFGITDRPDAIGQFDRFPAKFLLLAGQLNLDLEISYYKWRKWSPPKSKKRKTDNKSRERTTNRRRSL